MEVQRHPAFLEVKLLPPEGIPIDPNHPTYHTPFDSEHMKIKGMTHCNVRFFTKKYHRYADDILIVMGLLNYCYPLLTQYFKPDLRKMFDIAFRERKNIEEENA